MQRLHSSIRNIDASQIFFCNRLKIVITGRGDSCYTICLVLYRNLENIADQAGVGRFRAGLQPLAFEYLLDLFSRPRSQDILTLRD